MFDGVSLAPVLYRLLLLQHWSLKETTLMVIVLVWLLYIISYCMYTKLSSLTDTHSLEYLPMYSWRVSRH